MGRSIRTFAKKGKTKMNYIGIDNGITGSVGIVFENQSGLFPMPNKKCISYTKKFQTIHRIDKEALVSLLKSIGVAQDDKRPFFCLLERPMINPMRFKNSISAARALEAVLIVLEQFNLPYEYIDSKAWQKELLPSGTWSLKVSNTGKKTYKADPGKLKFASLEVAKRLYPSVNLLEFKDADGLLIAHYGMLQRKG